ncbi:hypothetical protein M427DRAFT_40711 [Gonapodya prolifera JEL478]|uniref:Uncharacterized protein n=1 Tax=Gonapodya prolifera (strain JEL478) TaxID=1344416 RepID=A0A139AZP9_GONPJ|nr:hypothetical protein M427DRAFT_40711 [Gonapodya prolifera JEL478]|eukprot:KXS21955.1 hypothetical protein M427DRAFT_40711 [Gonapodya prolifera JEL478]
MQMEACFVFASKFVQNQNVNASHTGIYQIALTAGVTNTHQMARRWTAKNVLLLAARKLPDMAIKIICAEHRPDYLVQLRCQGESCSRVAKFGNADDGKGKWCSEHKPADATDVGNKKCIAESCERSPKYGLADGKRLWCKEHAAEHEGSRDVANKRCSQEKCDNFAYIQGLCSMCWEILKPELLRQHRALETQVWKYICDNHDPTFPQPQREYRVQNQCSMDTYRRVDIHQPINDKTSWIIEVDENEHLDREVACEVRRMLEIIQHFLMHGKTVTRFIRFSVPDNPQVSRWRLEALRKELYSKGKEECNDFHVSFMFYSTERREALIEELDKHLTELGLPWSFSVVV